MQNASLQNMHINWLRTGHENNEFFLLTPMGSALFGIFKKVGPLKHLINTNVNFTYCWMLWYAQLSSTCFTDSEQHCASRPEGTGKN